MHRAPVTPTPTVRLWLTARSCSSCSPASSCCSSPTGVPVEIVAFATALTLWATDVLDLNQALAGFGDPTVLFIAALFVVSEALDATGVTAKAGQLLVARAGDSRRRLLVLMMLMCALLTALISVNGAVAALIPVVVVTAVKLRTPSSQLMMPLAFAAHAGSLLALTGSPVNVLVSEAANDAGSDYFGFFEFTLVGVPLLAGTIVIVTLLGSRLLAPSQRPLHAAGLQRTRASPVSATTRSTKAPHTPLFDRQSGVAEVVVPPRSGLIGEPAFPGMVTESGDLVVLAVHRKGEDLGPGATALAAGDVMLLRGTWEALADQPRRPRRSRRRRAAGCAPPSRAVRTRVEAHRRRRGGDGGAAGHRGGARRRGRLAGGRCADPDPRSERRAGVPRDQLDDHRARRWDDPAVDGDADEWRRRQGRRSAPRHRRWPLHAVDRVVRGDRRSRPADQQHRHRPDHHPRGARRLRRARHLRPARA